MYTYKVKDDENKDGLIIPNVGVITDGIIKSTTKLESPILELVEDTEETHQPEGPSPAHMNGVVPQNAQPAPIEGTSPSVAESESQL